MNDPMILTFVILAITIVIFISDKFRVDVVAMVSLLALTLTGIITPEQALAGFSNANVILIAGLFIVGGAVFQTGIAAWLGNRLLKVAGNSETRLLLALMLGTGVLSGFLSNTGTVAVLLPAVAAAAWRIGTTPSKLMLPLAFAGTMGGLLSLMGTPPNVVVSGVLSDAGLEPFGFFEFGLIGLPLLLVGVAYMLVVGRYLLPHREVRETHSQPTVSPEELASAYHLGGHLFRLRVRRSSQLIGKTLSQAYLGHDYGVAVIKVEHGPNGNGTNGHHRVLEGLAGTFKVAPRQREILIPGPNTVIRADDLLWVEGPQETVQRLAFKLDLGIQAVDSARLNPEEALLSQELGLAEFVITPRSTLIGQTVAEVRFGDKYQVQVLGISRRGKALTDVPLNTVRLTFGDALLVRGTWKNIGLLENECRDFVVVGRPATLATPSKMTPKAIIAFLAALGMLVMMFTGIVPNVIAVLLTAMVMILGGCLTMEQAYRSINWTSVILIAAMLPMGTALDITGGAEFIANGLVNSLGVWHPLLLLAGIFMITGLLTQVTSNTATSLLIAPIALQTALNMGVHPHALMMMVTVGASAAFLTPIATPVNTLVLTPGGYRFSDFMKVGLPLFILFFVVSLILVPLIWPI